MERQEPLSLNYGSRYKTLIFDFDGTIHDTIHVYFPAFLKGYQYLVDHDMAEPQTFTPKEVSIWLGYNSDDMWKTFMPNCPEVFQNKAKSIIGDEMRLGLESGKGMLYDGAHDVLSELVERGYKLVFLSNCS